ncbi:Transposase and inactivated derivatives, partial [Dysosmobacter welbionis]
PPAQLPGPPPPGGECRGSRSCPPGTGPPPPHWRRSKQRRRCRPEPPPPLPAADMEMHPGPAGRRSGAGRTAGPAAPPDFPPVRGMSWHIEWAGAYPVCPAGPGPPRPGTPPGSGRCSAGGSPPT